MVRLGGISRFPLYHLRLFVLSNFEGEILARRRCIFSSALRFCSEAATPHRRSDRMDSPPRQLLGAGKYYLSALFCAMRPVRDCPFSVQRAIKAGGDSRLDQVKHQPGTFSFWRFGWPRVCLLIHFLYLSHTPAASWVLLTGLPVYLVRFVARACFWYKERFSRTGECSPPASPRLIHPGLRCSRFICQRSSLRDHR